MNKVKIYALMCDNKTGAFVTGISTKTKIYTAEEFRNKIYYELTDGIEIIEGCSGAWSFDFINSDVKTIS